MPVASSSTTGIDILEDSKLDFWGALLSVLSTLLLIWPHILGWPVGLVAISIDAFLFYQHGIYADAGLQILYMIMSVYGWWAWVQGSGEPPVIRRLSAQAWVGVTGIIMILTVVLAWLLRHFFHSTVPWQDGMDTAASCMAMLLTAGYYIESWCLWFMIDVLSFFLFWVKGVPYHAGIQPFYLFLAVLGYLRWSRIMREGVLHAVPS